MSGYTAGPWKAEKDEVAAMTNIYDSQGKRLANVYWDHSEAEDHANARLMAAAPKMVEALLIIKGMAKNNAPCSARQIEAIADIALRAAGVEVER